MSDSLWSYGLQHGQISLFFTIICSTNIKMIQRGPRRSKYIYNICIYARYICAKYFLLYIHILRKKFIYLTTLRTTLRNYLSFHGHLLYMEKLIFLNSMPIKNSINHVKIHNNPLLSSWFSTMKTLKWLNVTLIYGIILIFKRNILFLGIKNIKTNKMWDTK